MEWSIKKVAVLLAVFCVLSGAVNAQATASPLQGRWVWNEQGAVVPEFVELVFFGNIMLLMEDVMPYYLGLPFIHTGGVIAMEGVDGFRWQYRLSGNTLHITNEYGENVSFSRVTMQRSPLEGFWEVTEGSGIAPEEVGQRLLFTGDIMAIGEDIGYMGFTIEFGERGFRPSLSSLGHDLPYIPEDQLEAFLDSLLMEYRISGNYLILTHQGEELVLRSIP